MDPRFGLLDFKQKKLPQAAQPTVTGKPSVTTNKAGQSLFSVPLLIGDKAGTFEIPVRQLDITSSCCKCPKEN
jgi:hypothetical protein